MYRVLPPFWMRAHAGRIVVSSCASDLSIEAARELAAVLEEVIAAAVLQERAKSQAPLPSVIVPPFEADTASAERGLCPMREARLIGEAAALDEMDRKRESAGDDE